MNILLIPRKHEICFQSFEYLLFIEKSSTQTQQHQLEGKSILQKRSKSSKNYTVEHHVKGILNSLVVKSHQKDKQVINYFSVFGHYII